MRYLFLSPIPSAYGEALHGIRIARELVAAGHEVVVLAPAAMKTLIADAPVTFGRIDAALPTLDQELPALSRRMRCDRLVLVDAAAVGTVVRALRLDVRAFTHPEVPVIALDCWDLPPAPQPWVYGDVREVLAPEIHAIERRLVPVPIVRPDVAGGFDALPRIATSDRAQTRHELGVGDDERLILWPTAGWQHASNHTEATLARHASELPARVLPRLASLGPRVRIVHVGPEPFANAPPCYQHVSQLAPARFEALVAAADLLVSFNAIASSIGTALVASTPVLLGTSAAMYAWPLDLSAILAPMLVDNPITDTLARVDLADERAYVEACRTLLFDDAAADAMRSRQAAYVARVRQLPRGAARVLELSRA